MARRPRPKRRERRQRGNVPLRRLGLALVIALPLLYFAFTRVFFDPFESAQPPFAVLVPRDVDLYVRRERLESDLAGLRPKLWDRLLATRAYKDLADTAWGQGQPWPAVLEAALAQAEAAAGAAPLDPLADLLGREVALVGRLPPQGAGDPQIATLLRISDRAKLAVEALDFDAALGKAFPGATLQSIDDTDVPGLSWKRLELPADAAPAGAGGAWFYARRTDMLVVSRDEGLVRDVLRQIGSGEQTSLGLSRLYHEELPAARGAPEDRLSLEFVVDARPLVERHLGAPDAAERSPDALENALRRLLDVQLLGECVGRLEADERLVLSLSADLADAQAGAPTAGLMGAPSFGLAERLRDVLGLLPADSTAAVTLNVELRPLLETVVGALGPDETRLLNDTIRDIARSSPAWRVDNLPALVAYLDRALGDELTVALRPLDHEVPPGSQPLPSLAFLFRVQDVSLFEAFTDAVVRGYKALGLDPDRMKFLDEGVGVRKWLGVSGLPMQEFSFIVLDGETAVIGTDDDFVREIVAVYTSQRSSAAARPEVRTLIDGFSPGARANLAAWGDAEALLRVIEPYAVHVADAASMLDLGVVRLQKGRELLESQYRAYQGREAEMPPDVKSAYEARLDQLVQEVEHRRLQEEVPRLADEWRQRRQWLKLLRQFAFGLRLGQHDASLNVQATTALGR